MNHAERWDRKRSVTRWAWVYFFRDRRRVYDRRLFRMGMKPASERSWFATYLRLYGKCCHEWYKRRMEGEAARFARWQMRQEWPLWRNDRRKRRGW